MRVEPYSYLLMLFQDAYFVFLWRSSPSRAYRPPRCWGF